MNGKELPKKIKYKGKEFDLHYQDDEKELSYYISDEFVLIYYIDNFYQLNEEIEIIEEEPEIDIQKIKYLDSMVLYNADESTFNAIADMNNKIGELIRAIKQLDKQIKEK